MAATVAAAAPDSRPERDDRRRNVYVATVNVNLRLVRVRVRVLLRLAAVPN